METRYKLGHKKAKKCHKDIINTENSYSLTLTLKPYYNALPIHEQHRLYTSNLSSLMAKINRTYNVVMATPELTKEYNIHYHLYLVLPSGEDHIRFEQALKTHITKSGVIGRNYRLKKIDSVTEILEGYPFKDITRTEYVKQRCNNLFTPYHSIFIGYNSWKII